MLEDDVVAATKQTITSTSNTGRYNEYKGKRSRDDRDSRGKCASMESRPSNHRNAVEGLTDRPIENPG